MSAFEGTSCAALAAVEKVCAEHALGLSNTIEIIEAADLTSIPAPDASSHTVSSDIVVESGKQFYQWKVGPTDAEFNATSIGSKGNASFQNVLTIFLPLSRDEVSKVVNDILNGEFVIRFGDKSGAKRILGNENSPAMVPDGGIQEVITSERNGHTVTFENIGKTPYFYTGAIPLTPVV